MNLMDVGEFDGRTLYAGLGLGYGLRLWTHISASHAVSAVAELLVCVSYNRFFVCLLYFMHMQCFVSLLLVVS